MLVLTFGYFLVSSICSTSLDSSTTLPSTIVWVTTFTIFLVRTSGSSVQTVRVLKLSQPQICFRVS